MALSEQTWAIAACVPLDAVPTLGFALTSVDVYDKVTR